MTASPSQPSRRLRGVAIAASVLWWALVAACIAFAVAWGALHVWIVPRLAELRPWLQEQASRQLGVDLRIGAIEAQADSWRHLPTIELRDIAIHDSQGGEALQIDRVRATLSPRSLWRLGVEQLVIDRPRLQAVRHADGRVEIAGIEMQPEGGNSLAANWFFTQRDVSVIGAAFEWRDGWRSEQVHEGNGSASATLEPLRVDNVMLVVSNRGIHHDFRLDADLPQGWGGRIQLAAKLRQPIVTLQPGQWQQWSGQIYADISRIDLSRLAPYAAAYWPESAMRVQAGMGQLRGWGDIKRGSLTQTTLDVDMRHVAALCQTGCAAPVNSSAKPAQPVPLALSNVSGRLIWDILPRGFGLATEGLQFSLADGLRWPGGNARMRYQAAGNVAPARGSFSGEALDLQALAQVAQRLPLGEAGHQAIRDYDPRGQIKRLDVKWLDKPPAASIASAANILTTTVSGLRRDEQDEQDAQEDRAEADAGAGTDGSGSSTARKDTQPWFTRLSWQARGEAEQVSLAAGPAAVSAPDATVGRPRHPEIGRPGLSGMDMRFDFTQDGGEALLGVHKDQQGQLIFPGVFEEPAIALDEFQASFSWRRQGDAYSVEVPRMSFANADAAGWASGSWQTLPEKAEKTDEAKEPGDQAEHDRTDSRLPGHLTLRGELSRAAGDRVYRYLPQEIPQSTRQYVRDAVRAGRATHTVFRINSDLDHFPPKQERQGDFYIAADLKGVDFDYVPAMLGSGYWPALSKVDAQLVFNRQSMEVRQASGSFAKLPGLRMTQASARIDDLMAESPLLQIDGKVSGPLTQALGYVRTSALDKLTGNAFAQSQGSGEVATRLALRIPLLHAEKTQLDGETQLSNATLQMLAQAPTLERLQGRVKFDEKGFEVSRASAHVFGGDLNFSGQGKQSRRGAEDAFHAQFDGQGTFTAQGMRQARELPLMGQLGQGMEGQAGYRLRLEFVDGKLQARAQSDMVGMALHLPEPFGKTAAQALPLQFDSVLIGPKEDHIRVRVGDVAKADFIRDLSGSFPRVERGAIRIDQKSAPDAPLPAQGVDLGVRLGQLDVSAWLKLLSVAKPTLADTGVGSQTETASRMETGAPVVDAQTDADAQGRAAAIASFLPSRLSVQADELLFQDRAMHKVSLTGERNGPTWSAQVQADEVVGRVAYQTGEGDHPGRLFARLDHLTLDTRKTSDAQSALQPGADTSATQPDKASAAVNDLLNHQPDALPALDIEVGQLKLGNKDLGKLKVLATNRGLRTPGTGASAAQVGSNAVHEWRLDTLAMEMPEATLRATGQWRAPSGADASLRRQTLLDFTLQTKDAGKLLDRLGYEKLFREGEGELKGNISWTGSPLSLDYPTLAGQVDVDMRDGQFLKADPGPARLLGVLSLQALPRRLTLDFRDAFSEGFAFDSIRGQADIKQGVAHTSNLQMKGVSAAVMMQGYADIVRERQDLTVVVMPELSTATLALLATAINPAVGLGTFVAQWMLNKPLTQSVTRTFRIRGTWADPDIQTVKTTDEAAKKDPQP